jgi:hypothetical protein
MSKVDDSRYSKARPKITQEDLADGDFTVVTIVKFDEAPGTDDAGQKRLTPFILTEEFGDKVLWLNRTQVRHLVDRLGDESDRWVGKRVPIVKHTATFGTDSFKKVVVPDTEEWDDLLAMASSESGEAVKKPRRMAAPTAKSKAKAKPAIKRRAK